VANTGTAPAGAVGDLSKFGYGLGKVVLLRSVSRCSAVKRTVEQLALLGPDLWLIEAVFDTCKSMLCGGHADRPNSHGIETRKGWPAWRCRPTDSPGR
jgi:hypothetical protein